MICLTRLSRLFAALYFPVGGKQSNFCIGAKVALFPEMLMAPSSIECAGISIKTSAETEGSDGDDPTCLFGGFYYKKKKTSFV